MDFEYYTVQPNRWTFNEAKIADWLRYHLPRGRILNACAGQTTLTIPHAEIVRNDLNPDVDADSHVAVRSLDDVYDRHEFDAIIFDSPFTPRQAEKHYDGYDIDRASDAPFRAMDELLAPGGRLLTFGYDAAGIPVSLEAKYEHQNLTIWNLLGRQADWFSTVLRKQAPSASQHAAQPHPTDTRHTGTASVNPEAHLSRDTIDRVTTGGNGGVAIDVSYIRLSDPDALSDRMSTVLAGYKSGLTGEITSARESFSSGINDYRIVIDEKHSTAQNFSLDSFTGSAPAKANAGHSVTTSPLKITTTTALSDHPDIPPADTIPAGVLGPHAAPDFTASVEEIPAPGPNARYDTLILNFHSGAASHNVETDQHGRTGFGTAIKHAADPLLARGGRVIQIGKTATNMPLDEYVRTHLTVISTPGTQYETIISVDQPTDTQRPARPAKDPYRSDCMAGIQTDEGTRYECVGCRERWHYHPAHYVDCPTCGSVPGNYCVNSDDTPRHQPHADRIEHFTERHQCAEPADSPVTPPMTAPPQGDAASQRP